MSSAVVRRKVIVSGRVQGVWFRDSTLRMARSLALSGWVRNRSDGRVEAEFEGPAAGVERAVAWCHDGPPRADVTGVEVQERPPIGDRGFRVR